jgi:hypothetical protein
MSSPELDPSEITHQQAMRNLLMDEDLSDLSLIAIDGEVVRSSRCILASRSKVFRGMLYGDFSEATSSSITLGYKREILKALVEYIYTDDCELFHECNVELARLVVRLADAANYFDLPGLSQKAKGLACYMMRGQPSLACVFLAECNVVGDVTSGIEGKARQTIRLNAYALLSPGKTQGQAILSLSPTLLETIIRDQKIEADEYTMFRILDAWSNATDDEMSHNNRKSGETLDMGTERREAARQTTERREAARQMTNHLRLDHIAPHDLSTTVTSSGLVTSEQLLEAYKLQALDAQREHNKSFNRKRCAPVGAFSNTRKPKLSRVVGDPLEQANKRNPSMWNFVNRDLILKSDDEPKRNLSKWFSEPLEEANKRNPLMWDGLPYNIV